MLQLRKRLELVNEGIRKLQNNLGIKYESTELN